MPVSPLSRNTLAAVIEVQDSAGNVVVPARVDIREAVEAEKLSDLREFTHVQGDSWGNVGHKALGDARHWWVVAELSGVLDPFTELTPGKTLKTVGVESLFLDILKE